MRDCISASTKPAHAGTIRLGNTAAWNSPAVYLQSIDRSRWEAMKNSCTLAPSNKVDTSVPRSGWPGRTTASQASTCFRTELTHELAPPITGVPHGRMAWQRRRRSLHRVPNNVVCLIWHRASGRWRRTYVITNRFRRRTTLAQVAISAARGPCAGRDAGDMHPNRPTVCVKEKRERQYTSPYV